MQMAQKALKVMESSVTWNQQYCVVDFPPIGQRQEQLIASERKKKEKVERESTTTTKKEMRA